MPFLTRQLFRQWSLAYDENYCNGSQTVVQGPVVVHRPLLVVLVYFMDNLIHGLVKGTTESKLKPVFGLFLL